MSTRRVETLWLAAQGSACQPGARLWLAGQSLERFTLQLSKKCVNAALHRLEDILKLLNFRVRLSFVLTLLPFVYHDPVVRRLLSALAAVALTVLLAMAFVFGLRYRHNTEVPLHATITQLLPASASAPTPPATPLEDMLMPPVLPPEIEIEDAPPATAMAVAPALPSLDTGTVIRTPVIPIEPLFKAWLTRTPKTIHPERMEACAAQGGEIVLAVYVLEIGKIADVALSHGSGCAVLDRFALAVAKEHGELFKPATESGKPVGAWFVMPPLVFEGRTPLDDQADTETVTPAP